MNPKIDEYISQFPKDVQVILEEIRQTVRKTAPLVQEKISYKMPTFVLNDKYLLYFAAWKKHISIYPISSAMEASIKNLSKYKTSGKGTVQFPLDKPIPFNLIQEIVKFRIKENTE